MAAKFEAGRIERDNYTIRIEVESEQSGYAYAIKKANQVREKLEAAL